MSAQLRPNSARPQTHKNTLRGLINHVVEHTINHMVERRSRKKVDAARDERLSSVFHTLADPSRRRIIELLREAGELKVGDLAEAFSMSLNGVSKHLKVLEKAGLVLRRVDGREHWISANWEALQQPYEWLHFYHHFWSGRLDSLVDYVKTTKGKDK